MLEIKNVTKIFNAGTVNEKVALDNVSLTLNDGDFVTVIGGNGAGKSTLQNIVAGTYFPDYGEILINGKKVTRMAEYKRAKYIGRVFQDPRIGTATDMWIEENMSLAMSRGKMRGLGWGISAKDRKYFKELLATLDLGLEDRLSTKVGLLSGGQRQAITLLMASMNHPELLLLDEHTAALDPKTAAKVLQITDEVISKDNLTTLMITHNMADAIRLGNRLIMMHEGKIILDISGEEKKNLTVPDLLQMFEDVSGAKLENDRMLLANK
ncbi:MAG: ABC transporter ATP-binding protein [Oscillospiraceae bacterium]|nr:ABC transporter ATP-binding protein [Oscillospiraceae bacterium]